MEREPKISVIVPAYNVENYIGQTLECLAQQMPDDSQVIVVNDGSTDGTQAIIDSFCGRYQCFESIVQANAGVSAARNRGISAARGKYVFFLDSDDLLTPGSLGAICSAHERTGADMVVSKIKGFGTAGEKYNPRTVALAAKTEIDRFDKDLLWNFLVGNKSYRRDTLLRTGAQYPALKYSEDGVFLFEFVMSEPVKITGTEGACLLYRRHDAKKDASVTQTVKLQLVQDFIAAMNAVYNAAQCAGASEDYLREIRIKEDCALLGQFYRLFWQCDGETLDCISRRHGELRSELDGEANNFVDGTLEDIGQPVFDRDELAASPKVSVIVSCTDPKELESCLDSVFFQTMMRHETFVKSSAAKGSEKSCAWLSCPNVTVLPDDGFMKLARRSARAKCIYIMKRPRKIDTRAFGFALKMGLPDALKRRFFTQIVNLSLVAAKILKR